MSSLLIRRVIAWGLSLGLGFVTTWATIVIGLPILLPTEAGKGLDDYGLLLTVLTIISVSLLFLTWLDYFMDTQILPD